MARRQIKKKESPRKNSKEDTKHDSNRKPKSSTKGKKSNLSDLGPLPLIPHLPKGSLVSPTSTSNVVQQSHGAVSLGSLGLKYTQKEMSTFSMNPRANHLRCTFCTSPNDYSIVLWCQPNTPGATWPERIIEMAIRDSLNWASSPDGLCFDLHYGRWYDDDIEQVNIDLRTGRSYGVRLFYIHVKKKPTENQMKQIGRIVADAVTKTKDNSIPLVYDEDTFFWLKHPVAWADVVGSKVAYDMLVKEIGIPTPGKPIGQKSMLNTLISNVLTFRNFISFVVKDFIIKTRNILHTTSIWENWIKI